MTLAPSPHSRHWYGVELLTSRHPAMRRLKRQLARTTHHGHKPWRASGLLLDFLQDSDLQGARVLDAGCGWGITAIGLAKRGAQVVGVDLDPSTLEIAKLHAEINQTSVEWRCQAIEALDEESLKEIDYLLIGDLLFWDSLVEPVYQLLERAIRAGVPRILIADPERPPFFTLAERAMEDFWAELFPWRAEEIPARGAILLIENA